MTRKLLFFVNTDSYFLSHRLPIALEALKKGFEVHVATGLTNGKQKMQSCGLIVHPLNLDRRSIGAFSNGYLFFQILCLFRRLKPDIVHLVTIKPVLLGGIAARLAAVPCVVAAISGLGFVFIAQGIKARIRCGLVKCLYMLALSHQNIKVIFQNEDDRAKLIKICRLPREKTQLIRGSGADLAAYCPSSLPKGQPIVVLAARLLVDKGVREFVQAARVLKHSGNAARFILVGKPDLGNPSTISDNELKQWIAEEVIECWGHRDDIPQVFASSHMVVLPSYREGLPRVLIEAAACGRAVITTNTPGCRDAIEPNVTGLLVPIRNTEALVGAIKQLLDDASLCEKMGRAGRKLAEDCFDIRQVIAQHLCIYDELINKEGLQQVTL